MKNLAEFEAKLEQIFTKNLPPLPENVKEAIVKVAPYLSLVAVIISVVPLLFALGLGALVAPLSLLGGISDFAGFSFSMIFMVIGFVLQIMAIPGLFAKSAKAWKLIFYSTFVGAVSNLVAFNLGGLIIGTGIGLYILFQVKSLYK